jgi:hypothetical protein
MKVCERALLVVQQFFGSIALIATVDLGVMPTTLSSVSSRAEKNHQTNTDLVRWLGSGVELRRTRSTENEGE